MDYLKLYDLERYLFDDVRAAFERNKKLTAFDFFCIVIWKANRAKSKVARKLVAKSENLSNDLNGIVEGLISAVANAADDKARMKILIEQWELRLPMASAILTVLYPENFTVYDERVCNELGKRHGLKNKKKIDRLWEGYQEYISDVTGREVALTALRDKDRTLWAKSFEKQLNRDIATLFKRNSK